MRTLLLMTLIFGVSFSAIRADDGYLCLFGMGQMGDFKDGALHVVAYPDSCVWYNGTRQYPHGDYAIGVSLKPGDVMEVSDSEGFTRYKFERLSSKRAYFTTWRYAAVREQLNISTWKISQSSLKSISKFEIDTDKATWLVECGANQLELNPKKSARTK